MAGTTNKTHAVIQQITDVISRYGREKMDKLAVRVFERENATVTEYERRSLARVAKTLPTVNAHCWLVIVQRDN